MADARPNAAGPDGRRAEILRIAAGLFAEQGFERTSMRDIGRAARILSGSLYHHFATKDAILHAIVAPAVRSMRAQVDRIAGSDADPEARIAALVMLSFDELLSARQAFAILYNERRYFRRVEGFDYVADAKRALYRAWRAALTDGMALGRFRAALDPFMAVTTIIRMLNASADWFNHGAEHGNEATEPTAAMLETTALDFTFRMIRASDRLEEAIPLEGARVLATPDDDLRRASSG